MTKIVATDPPSATRRCKEKRVPFFLFQYLERDKKCVCYTLSEAIGFQEIGKVSGRHVEIDVLKVEEDCK